MAVYTYNPQRTVFVTISHMIGLKHDFLLEVSIVGCFSLYRMFNEKLRQKFSNIARALILPVMSRPILAPKNHMQEKGSKVINFFRKCAVLTPP